MSKTFLNPIDIAFFETGNSHDECLLTQLNALQNKGLKTALICNQEILERNPNFESIVDEVFTVCHPDQNKQQFREILKAYRSLKKRKLKLLILNSAHGGTVKRLSILSLFDRVNFIGIAHYAQKFNVSAGQRIINLKVKKYIFLAEFLIDNIAPRRRHKFDYFYPIRFQYPIQEKEKTDKPVVTIIGSVENYKKDLDGFLALLSRAKGQDIKFIFLGKSNLHKEEVKKIKKMIAQLDEHTEVKLYFDFVPNEEFTAVLESTHLILPLIHPKTESGEMYFKTKISGGMNVSIGHKIPMLIHESLKNIEEIQEASVYYNFDNFFSVINNKSNYAELPAKMKLVERFQLSYQEDRYFNIIKSFLT
jgi:hypothetical protein